MWYPHSELSCLHSATIPVCHHSSVSVPENPLDFRDTCLYYNSKQIGLCRNKQRLVASKEWPTNPIFSLITPILITAFTAGTTHLKAESPGSLASYVISGSNTKYPFCVHTVRLYGLSWTGNSIIVQLLRHTLILIHNHWILLGGIISAGYNNTPCNRSPVLSLR